MLHGFRGAAGVVPPTPVAEIFLLALKSAASDAAEGGSRVECTASWDKQKVSSQLLANADCLVAFHA